MPAGPDSPDAVLYEWEPMDPPGEWRAPPLGPWQAAPGAAPAESALDWLAGRHSWGWRSSASLGSRGSRAGFTSSWVIMLSFALLGLI